MIISEKMNRTVASLIGALITYLVLIYIEGNDYSIIIDLLIGTPEDGYVNFHSLVLIVSMMIIVEVSHEAGLFQFISARLIKLSNGDSIKLLGIFCTITILLSAVLNNILTVIILIPLTINVSRILNIDPSPYILTQAILVNIGGTFFTISSIPNILITTFAGIDFSEFFINVGIISIITFLITLSFFIFLYKEKLTIPKESLNVLEEFDVWNYVSDKVLLKKSGFCLIFLFILFILIPSSVIATDFLALAVALFLLVISKLNAQEIIEKTDFELTLYLLGIFLVAGGLELTGVITIIGNFLQILITNNFLSQILIILWFSAILSSIIDNIPITKVLIPIISVINSNNPSSHPDLNYYSLAIGANWGDNLTPLGDNVLVMKIAEENKRPIKFMQFFKIGFFTTLLQLIIGSIIYTLILETIVGIVLIISIIFLFILIYILLKMGNEHVKKIILNLTIKIRKIIIE